MRGSTVLSLPVQLVFPGCSIISMCLHFLLTILAYFATSYFLKVFMKLTTGANIIKLFTAIIY
jgi:hypothetical protein